MVYHLYKSLPLYLSDTLSSQLLHFTFLAHAIFRNEYTAKYITKVRKRIENENTNTAIYIVVLIEEISLKQLKNTTKLRLKHQRGMLK